MNKNNQIAIAEKKQLVKKIVFLNGITRAGKFFLGKVLAGFNNLEYFQYVSLLDHIAHLQLLAGMSENCAISLLQIQADEYVYNMSIGRNLNLRFDDASSLHNSLELNNYLKRSQAPIPKTIAKEINSAERLPIFILHNCLPNIKIFLKAFSELKWINLLRHPVDVVYSWHKRGWGHRFGFDPLAFSPTIKGIKDAIPWYAYNCKDEYERISEIDRVIKSIAVLSGMDEEAYRGLNSQEKEKVLFISYENLIENTDIELHKVGSFLGVAPCKNIDIILTRERCRRKIPPQERKSKIEEIKNMASKEKFALLMELALNYEKKD